MTDNIITEVDLSTFDLPSGSHTITTKAKATGYLDSQASNSVTYTVEPAVYNITISITNGSYTGAATIQDGANTTITIMPNTHYDFPRTVEVTGADYFYNVETGEILLSNPVDNIVITAACRKRGYLVNAQIEYGNFTGPVYMEYDEIKTAKIEARQHYDLPTSITVMGGSAIYNQNTGDITLQLPYDDINIIAECPEHPYSIMISISNGTYSGAAAAYISTRVTCTLIANSGYVLPHSITVSGAESYTYNSTTGEVSLSQATENVTISAICSLASTGLAFVSNNDGTCYVSGIGSCRDTDIVVPATSPRGDLVTGIGQEAFMDSDIQSINLRDSIEYISDRAFYHCWDLSGIGLGENSHLEWIGNSAFAYTELWEVSLPNSVKNIYPSAFYSCPELRKVTIGTGVEWISDYAFASCGELFREGIYIYATTPPYLSNINAFSDTGDCRIYVPNAAVYREAATWSQIEERIYYIE